METMGAPIPDVTGDVTGDMFFVVDNAGHFTYVSPHFARLLGYPAGELRGRDSMDFIRPDDRDRQRRSWEAWQWSSGQPWHAESRWMCGDRERVLRFTVWHDESSGLSYAAGQEITDGRVSQERAALRRVAALVARGRPPAEVFNAVTAELRALLGVAACMLGRYESDDLVTVLSDSVDSGMGLPDGTVLRYQDNGPGALLRSSASPVMNVGTATLPSPLRERAEGLGVTEAVKVPVMVDGQVWGYLSASWRRVAPPDVTSRMARFTELVTMAIGDAEGRAALLASRERLAAFAEEQAALRRVATVVAAGAATSEGFDAVAEELRKLLDIEGAVLQRYEDDGTATVVAISDPEGLIATEDKVGSRVSTENGNLVTRVRRSGHAELTGSYDDPASVVLPDLGGAGVMGAVGVPLTVSGLPWGMAAVAWRRPVARSVESRLTKFTELLSIAIANADSRERLDASRLRVVTAADQARQRIERDLHDGVQQRLVALALDVRELSEHEVSRDDLRQVNKTLSVILEELREIVAGIHPPVLRQHGLGRAVRGLARRTPMAIPLDLRLDGPLPDGRLPESAEIAGYYAISELITNAAKHSGVDTVSVEARTRAGELLIAVRDAGAGGADSAKGTGLTGLRDRIEALGGSVTVDSPPGHGTSVLIRIPLPEP
jgi:PAS domain S-box-containing protein